MSSKDRQHTTVHVDVARPLLKNTDNDILKTWLEWRHVTDRMFGIDGGYSESSPAAALSALGVDSDSVYDNVRLLETNYKERRTHRFKDRYGFVKWMETLPKYTQRAQKVEYNQDTDEYTVVTHQKPPAEQLLAWVVEHDTWREVMYRKIQTDVEPEVSKNMSTHIKRPGSRKARPHKESTRATPRLKVKLVYNNTRRYWKEIYIRYLDRYRSYYK